MRSVTRNIRRALYAFGAILADRLPTGGESPPTAFQLGRDRTNPNHGSGNGKDDMEPTFEVDGSATPEWLRQYDADRAARREETLAEHAADRARVDAQMGRAFPDGVPPGHFVGGYGGELKLYAMPNRVDRHSGPSQRVQVSNGAPRARASRRRRTSAASRPTTAKQGADPPRPSRQCAASGCSNSIDHLALRATFCGPTCRVRACRGRHVPSRFPIAVEQEEHVVRLVQERRVRSWLALETVVRTIQQQVAA